MERQAGAQSGHYLTMAHAFRIPKSHHGTPTRAARRAISLALRAQAQQNNEGQLDGTVEWTEEDWDSFTDQLPYEAAILANDFRLLGRMPKWIHTRNALRLTCAHLATVRRRQALGVA